MMADPENPNLAQLIAVAEKLEPLLDRLTFVGGCVTGLLITDPASAPVRPTLDVDAIVEIASYIEFTVLEGQLRSLGFHSAQTPICRWTHGSLLLDLMPADPSILGFSNRWYDAAMKNADKLQIGAIKIRLITAPYFLGTKLEAFHGRGNNDYRGSHDLEDVITVIDGRPELVAEVQQADVELRQFLKREFSCLLTNRSFLEAIPGHLLPDAASQQRLSIIMARINQIVSG